MIAQTCEDAFCPEWTQTPLAHPTHALIILRHILPWQPIIERLVPFYHPHKGRPGHSLRILVATAILSRLRQRSDRKVIEEMQENRSRQYFCTVPDHSLMTFVNPSTLCRFRTRLGKEGPLIVEDQVLQHLKRAAVIHADMMLMDTTVLERPIIDPTDVRLLSKAFGKMEAVAREGQIELWWDQAHVKQRWRAYNLSPKDRLASLHEFSPVFVPAFERFAAHLDPLPQSPLRQRWSHLLEVLTLLDAQTQQPLAGESHMNHRVVSRDDRDARPLKQGKSSPSTAFGTTLQMTVNRQGLMITTDNFMGQPNDTTLYGPTLERFRERMHAYPGTAVTDLGFRRAKNLTRNSQEIDHGFRGRSAAVDEAQQEDCRKARSAPAGFLAVAKHLRGFGRSLSRGLPGATLWTRLSPCAYNLKKFLQLYRAEALEESTLLTLRLSSISPAGDWASVDRPPNSDGMARCPPPVRPHMAATGPE
jgi:IS5 family transposase